MTFNIIPRTINIHPVFDKKELVSPLVNAAKKSIIMPPTIKAVGGF